MPAGFFVDGKLTYRPLVSVITEFAGRSGLTPANKVLAVVGEFPFLEKDVPYLFTSQTSFLSSVPVNNTMRELANIIYNPSTVAPFAGSPAGVILLNAKPNTRAVGYIADDGGVIESVKLSANVWGQQGNSTAVSIVEAADGVRTITITNRGSSETFTAASGLNVIKLTYDHPGGTSLTTAYGFGDEGGGSGTLTLSKPPGVENAELSFDRTIPNSALVEDQSGDFTWVPDAPIAGTLTVHYTGDGEVSYPAPPSGTATTVLRIRATGLGVGGNPVVGTADLSVSELIDGLPGSKALTFNGTAVEFSAVTGVWVYPYNDEGYEANIDPGPDFRLTGKVFDQLGPDSGQETAAQAIQYLNSLKGFSASTDSFKAATTPFANLDACNVAVLSASETPVASMDSTRWTLVQAIKSNSSLVSIEDLYPSNSALLIGPSNPLILGLAGGSETAISPNNWLSAFAALMTSPVTVLFPYTNNHDVHVAALDHVRLMWGKGQRECQLVVAPTPNSTLVELNQKRRDLQDFRVTMLPHSIRIAQWDGSTSAYSTLYTGLMFASMQCANPEVGLPMGGGRPRALAFNGHSSIMGTDAADTLLGNCMTPLEDLGDGIKIVRWVTTYSEDNDLVRTEGSSVEAIAFSNIGVRNAVKPFLNTKATPAVAPAIRSAIAAELADQVYRGVLRSWQADSLFVEETATSFLARYTISPVLPVNHIAVTSVAIAFPIA